MTGDLDSRIRHPRGIRELVRLGGIKVLGEPVYCTSCSKQDGWVPVELPPGLIYLCGDCESQFGVPPEMVERTDIEQTRST